jgi:hypothetical protein
MRAITSSLTPVALSRAFASTNVERMRGIEPPYSAWEADVLPLNYIRERATG